MTTLIIARHGNTFTADQTPTRVGARTDLPLVPSGCDQAQALGAALKEASLRPDLVYVSSLQRTQQTARIALDTMGVDADLNVSSIFDEIDYGPDENQPEDKVIARIGAAAIKAWNDSAIPPNGWLVNPDDIRTAWQNFTQSLINDHAGKTILVVTSNGTARFAPEILSNYNDFINNHKLKLSTGAYGVLEHNAQHWICRSWNIRP